MDGSSEITGIQLRRSSSEKPWGFALVGGVDQLMPIHIQKVSEN